MTFNLLELTFYAILKDIAWDAISFFFLANLEVIRPLRMTNFKIVESLSMV